MAANPPSDRKPRADAERNRERLLEAAMSAFAAHGAAASLEEIARQAGVGIGTLYRHFPTRAALVEHVYRSAVERLGAAARDLAKTKEPIAALRDWMLLFVDYLARKRIVADVLTTESVDTRELYASTGSTLRDAISLLTDRAVSSGEIRLDMEPLDLLRAIAGVANASPGQNWEAGAKRMVDVLIAGTRTD